MRSYIYGHVYCVCRSVVFLVPVGLRELPVEVNTRRGPLRSGEGTSNSCRGVAPQNRSCSLYQFCLCVARVHRSGHANMLQARGLPVISLYQWPTEVVAPRTHQSLCKDGSRGRSQCYVNKLYFSSNISDVSYACWFHLVNGIPHSSSSIVCVSVGNGSAGTFPKCTDDA